MVMKNKKDRRLFDSARNFKLLVDNVADYALFMLDTEGIVSTWNIGAQRIKGYDPEEIVGQHFSRFYTDTDRAADKPTRALAIAREKGRFEDDGFRVRKDGSFFRASVVIDPIYDNGELVGYAKITRDVTERYEAALKLQKVQKQLADSQRMDALGQLTGGVAHDFNNLLMIISGSLIHMRKAAEHDERLRRSVLAVEKAAERGASLTRQLLTFARRQSVTPEIIDFRERAQGVKDLLRTAVGKNIQVEMEVGSDTWPILVDLAEFETALVNLAINARDAMPGGGKLSMAVHNRHLEQGDHHGDFVIFEACDEGEGIPPDIIAKVFEPFFTTKAIGKGTGLGLSQVHGFVHQAGGFLDLNSELGKGTQVTLYLPRSLSPTDRPTNDEETLSGNGRVLLVEDNPSVAEVCGEMLEQLGYSVARVSNGLEALDAIDKNGIDLVFSDIVMPGRLDGIELARQVRQRRPDIPILLTTGYSGARKSEFPILRKPYQIHELSEALAALVK
ncbi:MAG: response regulator [Rhizobiales bacterium]|jgi:PAS domain S-box-containing protein|nr:response regulator [Hyphomicrobiales bacterium]